MKRTKEKTLRILIRIIITKNDKTTQSTTLHKKSSARAFIQDATNVESFYIRVTYEPKLWNDATTKSAEECISWLNKFTEKPLLDYVEATR
jgi:hypothetical protein